MTIVEQLNVTLPAAVMNDELQTQTVYMSYWRVVHSPPDDVSTADQMNVVEASGILDFWDDPEEDIYTGNDGDAT